MAATQVQSPRTDLRKIVRPFDVFLLLAALAIPFFLENTTDLFHYRPPEEDQPLYRPSLHLPSGISVPWPRVHATSASAMSAC